MPLHPLTNFEIQNHSQNEPKFKGVYSRNNLPNTMNGAYVVNLDKHKSIGTHWITLYVFVVKYIQEEIRRVIGNKNIITNIFRIQTYNWIMCGYFCIGVIDFMINVKSRTDFTNLFLPHKFKKNDKLILDYFLR